MLTLPCVRGCGTRDKGGTYLCAGTNPFGQPIENFILDPVHVWPGEWQRGFKIIPTKNGFNDVVIFVGEQYYKSLWDFVEEARRFGISRKVSPTFPFGQLTPGKSRMVLLHRKAYPKFAFDIPEIDPPLPECRIPLKKYNVFDNSPLEIRIWTGWHNGSIPCTFAHQHLASGLHKIERKGGIEFTIDMPEFSYSGHFPLFFEDSDKYLPGAFLAVPLSHIEFPKVKNRKSEVMANKASYQTFVVDY